MPPKHDEYHMVPENYRYRSANIQEDDTILHIIQQIQCQWLGHVSRMSDQRLPKIALTGSVKGDTKKGRAKTSWIKTNCRPAR